MTVSFTSLSRARNASSAAVAGSTPHVAIAGRELDGAADARAWSGGRPRPTPPCRRRRVGEAADLARAWRSASRERRRGREAFRPEPANAGVDRHPRGPGRDARRRRSRTRRPPRSRRRAQTPRRAASPPRERVQSGPGSRSEDLARATVDRDRLARAHGLPPASIPAVADVRRRQRRRPRGCPSHARRPPRGWRGRPVRSGCRPRPTCRGRRRATSRIGRGSPSARPPQRPAPPRRS